MKALKSQGRTGGRHEQEAQGSRKRCAIITFGCQMNEYDSTTMASLLAGEYDLTEDPADAHLIIVNTCSIREKAEHKLYSLVGRFRRLKERRPGLRIAVCGCVAQQEKERLFQRMPHIDMVFGPQGLYRLPQMLARLEAGQERVMAAELDEGFSIPAVPRSPLGLEPARAYVTIMQGCDNFCTYCIVPFVRGREVSRPAGDILDEIGQLVDMGIKDVTLLGQNVNSYGRKGGAGTDFAGLLSMIDRQYPGIRLRFTTSHPRDLSVEVMECFERLDTLCEHLHLPVQAGSDRVLKRMNRHYSRREYLEKVELLRKIRPDIVLTTDLIVGFPGEEEEDFRQTLTLLDRVRFAQAFAFKYSPRPGTAAARFEDQLAEDVKGRRLSALLAMQEAIGLECYRALEGTVQELLVERVHPHQEGMVQARTRGNHVVNLQGGSELVGRIVHAEIYQACNHSLKGRLCAEYPDENHSGIGDDPLARGSSNEDHTDVCTCDNT